MSIEHDLELMKKYDEIKSIGSMSVTISREQVMEVVVADLMAKYKACKSRGDDYTEAFRKVLSFYLADDEMAEMEAIE